jgi:NodT family efflux transporter outer membrane factor (OMF) lipoprotein
VQAATAARNAVLISVVADVVRTYFDLRAFQMRMAVTRQNIATSQQTLDVVQARYDRGLTNELDLTLAKRELATVKAKVAPLASEIDAARYTIATLLGRYPEDLGKELENPGVIPDLPGEVGTGLPVDLLRRRPDILEAERQLASATARIGVATANLFPHLSLTAAVGFQAGRGAGMSPMTTNPIWSAGPTAYWSLLDFGTLDALVNVADLQARAQLINYKRTIINAVQEADTAISRYTAQQDRLRSLGDAVVASQRAVTLATERYNRGLTDFLNVSDAERVEYDLEGQYVVAKQAAAVALVALYKALGGGWEHYGSLPPIRQPQPAIVAAFRRLLFDNENAEQ